MPLPTSGPISLNDIHVEAGGTSGSLTRINDADNRGLINKAASVKMSFSEWYGASAEIPDPVPSARSRDAGNAATSTGNHVIRDAGTANAEAGLEFNMRKITNGFEVRVRETENGIADGTPGSAINSRFFDTSGSGSDLERTFRRLFIINNYAIDSYKVNWAITSGSQGTIPDGVYTDSNLKAADNTFYSNANRYFAFYKTASASGGGGQFSNVIVNLDFVARKSGVPDKTIGQYKIEVAANADSVDVRVQ